LLWMIAAHYGRSGVVRTVSLPCFLTESTAQRAWYRGMPAYAVPLARL
jgi:hypothetical protein